MERACLGISIQISWKYSASLARKNSIAGDWKITLETASIRNAKDIHLTFFSSIENTDRASKEILQSFVQEIVQ